MGTKRLGNCYKTVTKQFKLTILKGRLIFLMRVVKLYVIPVNQTVKQKKAEQFCSGCHQYMCSNCASFHLRFDAYKDHRLTKLQCYPCNSASETRDAELFCLGCDQYMCDRCARLHLRFDAHKDHILIQPKNRQIEKRQDKQTEKRYNLSKMLEKFQTTVPVTDDGHDRAEREAVVRNTKKEKNVKNKYGSGDRRTKQREQTKVPSNMIHQRDIDVGVRESPVCDITGSVYMGNKRLAIVDFYNDRVSIVNILKGNVVSHLKLDSTPWAITHTDHIQLVVTAAPYLVFLNVGKTLTVDKKLKVGVHCWGIDYTDNMLIVSFIKPGLVKFMRMDGRVMKSIHTDMNGEPLFVLPLYVVASKDKTAVYVTDCNYHTVTKLDMNGIVIDLYSRKDLRGPRGVTVDKYDNAYIAGWFLNNICGLTAGRRQIQPLLKVVGAHSCVVCDDSDQIVVSHYASSEKKM